MIFAQLTRIEGRDAFTVIAVLLLCVYAVSKTVFPKVFSEIISANRLFGFRVREDLGTNLRPFSSEHLYFTALSSLTFSFIVLYLLNGLPLINKLPVFLKVDVFGWAMLQWLGLAVLINVSVYLKFLLIACFGLLFDLRPIISRHFIDMVNASIFFFLVLLVFLVAINFSAFVPPKHLLNIVLILLVIFYYYRSLLLYVRMLNDRAHSKLYIFSYLCATELMPFTIGFILVLTGQI